MTTVEEFAPAKVNLTLHITGKRDDGYHLLDSLVAFAAGVGDRVTVEAAQDTTLVLTGPFGHGLPTGPDNLVLKAAALMNAPAKITLEKNLPPASGIGGGSADAAATLRALSHAYDVPLPDTAALLTLGADVPVCMERGVVRMSGIGDVITPVFGPLAWPLVLVNPGVEVSTAAVFAALTTPNNAPMASELYDPAYFEFPDWLGRQRNDLEIPARSTAPVISDVIAAILEETGCRFARMSGSGATCFGVFDTTDQAEDAAAAIEERHPDWWVRATTP